MSEMKHWTNIHAKYPRMEDLLGWFAEKLRKAGGDEAATARVIDDMRRTPHLWYEGMASLPTHLRDLIEVNEIDERASAPKPARKEMR